MRIIEVIKNFLVLYSYLSKRRKVQTYFIIFLMTISSILEVFSIGMIIPFLSVLLDPLSLKNLFKNIDLLYLIKQLGIDNTRLFLMLIFISAFTLSNIFKMSCIYLFHRISNSVGADLNMIIFKNLLFNKYHETIKENSSYRISAVSEKAEAIIGLFYNAFTFFSGSIILFFTSIMFLVFKPGLTLFTLFALILLFLIISKFLNNHLLNLSESISNKMSKKIIIFQEAFGGLRQIILDKTQGTYLSIFEEQETGIRKSQALARTLTYIPRYIVEILGIILISFVSYYLMQNQVLDTVKLVTFLGFIGFAAIRLLPVTTSMYQSYNSLLGNGGIVNEFSRFMKNKIVSIEETKIKDQIKFKKNLIFKNVEFIYSDQSKFKLKNINFEILKNQKIGIVGETGSGKSTLVDLIIGLLEPFKGQVLIDGANLKKSNILSWQENISHVPQEIFLMDRSIAENIAFTVYKKDIDYDNLKEAIKLAELEDFVNNLNNREKTLIGERGIFLSGGQKQRIGLARAFYNQKQLLILDEATSALDIETERKIINNIRNKFKNITIIQISHRIKTLENADKILKFDDDGFLNSVNFNDLV